MWINLEKLGIIGLFLFGTIASFGFVYKIFEEPQYEIKYDCRLASISPDYPLEVKSRCQNLLNRNSKDNFNEPDQQYRNPQN